MTAAVRDGRRTEKIVRPPRNKALITRNVVRVQEIVMMETTPASIRL